MGLYLLMIMLNFWITNIVSGLVSYQDNRNERANNMNLRLLRQTDAKLILEWMHDEKVNKNFRFDPLRQTEATIEKFINESFTEHNKHYAIVDVDDIYLGTVSLKNINYKDLNAEYAIALRYCAQGKGTGTFATKKILNIAFSELKLNKVYLNVLEENKNAQKMYEKNGFCKEGTLKNHIFLNGEFKSLQLYSIFSRNEV